MKIDNAANLNFVLNCKLMRTVRIDLDHLVGMDLDDMLVRKIEFQV